MKKPSLKKPPINEPDKIEPKNPKVKIIPFTEKSSNKILDAYDHGGEALVVLKDALFDNTNTNDWLSTFRKIQPTLDKIPISERSKLMRYICSPDFRMWFSITNDAKDWTRGLNKDQLSKLLSLLATQYSHIYKGSVPKTLNVFNKFKDRPMDEIIKFFEKLHGEKP